MSTSDIFIAERELGFIAAQWQDTDRHTPERTNRYARSIAQWLGSADILPSERYHLNQYLAGRISDDSLINLVLAHVYGWNQREGVES